MLSKALTLQSSALQPMDAAAHILDGGLLGAQDQTYVARSMVFTAAVCFAGLSVARHWKLGAHHISMLEKVICCR